MVVDIENSSGRPEYVRARLQRDAHDLIGRTLTEAGAASEDWSLAERGDGALIVLPSGTSKTRLTEVCLHGLPARLRRLAAQHSEFGRLRLRVALSAGEISRTEQGSWLGDAVDGAFRLNDAAATKAALADSADAVMVLVVSGRWFEDVVRPGLGAAEEHEFRQHTVTTHGREFPAWLALPGAKEGTGAADGSQEPPAAPAGEPVGASEAGAAAGAGSADHAAPASESALPAPNGPGNSAHYVGGDQIVGNKIVYQTGPGGAGR